MNVWIVFEYVANGSEVVGVYKDKEVAIEEHRKSPAWRYIEEHEVE